MYGYILLPQNEIQLSLLYLEFKELMLSMISSSGSIVGVTLGIADFCFKNRINGGSTYIYC